MWDLEQKVEELNLERHNVYFKMHCLYNAKTELFDRSLTDMRSKHDPTEAFIDVSSRVRNTSNQYAKLLYENCKRNIEAETKEPFSRDLWIRSIRSYRNLSAQGWIDLYEFMVKNGDIYGVEMKIMNLIDFHVVEIISEERGIVYKLYGISDEKLKTEIESSNVSWGEHLKHYGVKQIYKYWDDGGYNIGERIFDLDIGDHPYFVGYVGQH